MQPTISTAKKQSAANPIVILIDKKTKLDSLQELSDQPIDSIKAELKDHHQSSFRSDRRQVFVFEIKEQQFDYELKEFIRNCGFKACSSIQYHAIDTLEIQNYSTVKNAETFFIEGLLLSNYSFLKYKKDKKNKQRKLKKVIVINPHNADELKELSILCESVFLARDLVNEPVSFLTAVQLSKEIQKIGNASGLKVEVFNKKKIESLKMGGLLAVNKGSIDPPTFTIIEWKPNKANNDKPYVLVGKGVVYDTGGLSLKPTPNSMDLMKSDMGGAAAMIGAMHAIAKAKLPVHVIALIPSTDNRPGQAAYAPGDVIKMYSGQTVEVLNTDAEGRMLLADALSYAEKFDPALVIDAATLTGSALGAIGNQGSVTMGTADKKTLSALKKSGEEVYERLVEFPLWDEYDKLLESDIADMKNIGGPYAGAITAGKFLQKFTNYPWIHLDIAGTAFSSAVDSYRGKNGTGVGVRLLYHFFQHIS